MEREQELAQLIKEQARDMKHGHIVSHEGRPEVTLTEGLSVYLSNDGFRFPFALSEYEKQGCAVHGRQFLRPPSPSEAETGRTFRCTKCTNVIKQRYRLTHREAENARRRVYERKRYEDPEFRERRNRQRRESYQKKRMAGAQNLKGGSESTFTTPQSNYTPVNGNVHAPANERESMYDG